MTAEQLREIITAMMGLETALAEFYKTCRDTWPLDKNFWNKISFQETGHAEMLDNIRQILSLNPGLFSANREVSVKSIEFTTNEVKDATVRIKSGKISEERVFFMARGLEQCVLDSKPYEFIGTMEGTSTHILAEIARQTEEHRDAINKKIEEKHLVES